MTKNVDMYGTRDAEPVMEDPIINMDGRPRTKRSREEPEDYDIVLQKEDAILDTYRLYLQKLSQGELRKECLSLYLLTRHIDPDWQFEDDSFDGYLDE